jgi:hypothetical protein
MSSLWESSLPCIWSIVLSHSSLVTRHSKFVIQLIRPIAVAAVAAGIIHRTDTVLCVAASITLHHFYHNVVPLGVVIALHLVHRPFAFVTRHSSFEIRHSKFVIQLIRPIAVSAVAAGITDRMHRHHWPGAVHGGCGQIRDISKSPFSVM